MAHDEEYETTEKADVQTADHEHMKSATFPKSLRRTLRKVVTITKERSVQHARGFRREPRVDLALKPFSPIIEFGQKWKDLRVIEPRN
jgi:hypothetical protein